MNAFFVLEFEGKTIFIMKLAFAMPLYPNIFLLIPTTVTLDYSWPIWQRQEEHYEGKPLHRY